MKNTTKILPILVISMGLSLVRPAAAAPTDLGENMDDAGSPAAAVSCEQELQSVNQELQKTKDLVGIWKGHVKTLTKERDDANKELEALRGQSGPAPKAAAVSTADAKAMEELKYELNDLRAENQELKANMNRMQSQPAPAAAPAVTPADNARMAELQRQINEQQRNQAVMTAERSKLSAQIADLKEQLANAQDAGARGSDDEDTAPKMSVDEGAMRELKAKVTMLQDENARLQRLAAQSRSQAPADDPRVAELETQVARLRDQNERLMRQSAVPSLSSAHTAADEDVQKLIRDKEEAERAYAQLESESKNETQKLKTLVFTLQAENKKLDVLREELRKAQSENDATRQAFADMERNLRGEIDSANGKLAQAKGENERLRGYESEIRAATDYKQQAEAAYRTLEDNHQSEVQRLQTRIASLQADSDQLKVVRGELKKTLDQKAMLEQAVADLKATQSQLERRIQEQEGTIDMHAREIQQVRAGIESQLEALSQKTVRR